MLKSMFNFMPWGKTTNPVESDCFNFMGISGDIIFCPAQRGTKVAMTEIWRSSPRQWSKGPVRSGRENSIVSKKNFIWYSTSMRSYFSLNVTGLMWLLSLWVFRYCMCYAFTDLLEQDIHIYSHDLICSIPNSMWRCFNRWHVFRCPASSCQGLMKPKERSAKIIG